MKRIRDLPKTMSLLILLICSLTACDPTDEFKPPMIALGEIVVEAKTLTIRINCIVQGDVSLINSCGLDYGFTEDFVEAKQVIATIKNGLFTVDISDLEPNRTYYYRGYLKYTHEKEHTLYTEVKSFKIEEFLPTLTTTAVSSITKVGAVTGGNIIDDGGINIISQGVVWSISENPTIDLSSKTEEELGVGSFLSTITGLYASTVYYLRAYATNALGTSYGNEISFYTINNIKDKTALIAIYSATSGANWTNNANWNTESSIGTWHGITVENGFVTKVDLANNNLTGDIPSDVGNIIKLQTLDVSMNRLTSLDIRKVLNLVGLRCGNQKENKALDLYLTELQAKSWDNTWKNYSNQINFRVNLSLEGIGDSEDIIHDGDYEW